MRRDDAAVVVDKLPDIRAVVVEDPLAGVARKRQVDTGRPLLEVGERVGVGVVRGHSAGEEVVVVGEKVVSV